MKEKQARLQVVRGPITWSDFTALRFRMEQKWKPFLYSKEIVILLDRLDSDVRIRINSFDCKVVYRNREVEKTILLNHYEVIKVIELLDILKVQDWIISNDEKYEIEDLNYFITFRFNTHIGDFFEIKQKNNSISESVECEIESIQSEFQLKKWDSNIFDKLNEKAWNEISSTRLFVGNDLDTNIKDFLEKVGVDIRKIETVSSRLQMMDNDYLSKEFEFKNNSDLDLLSKEIISGEHTFSKKISIVIPTYNCMDSLPYTLDSIKNQNLTDKEKSLVEVVVIDDGSKDETEKFIQTYEGIENLIYVRQNNMGMACAGNTGVNFAKGEIILFIDADIVLEKNYIKEHAIRHSILNDVVLVSFTENISINEFEIKMQNEEKPNIYSDFRFSKNIYDSNLQMYRYTRDLKLREVKIIEETDDFKKFGNARVLETWDLPSMVITNAISFKKRDYELVGGLSMQFKGWGMEDAFLGASLIALGNYIVPVFSTGVFHLDHPPRSGSLEVKMEEFRLNASRYLELINSPLETVLKSNKNKRNE